MLSHKRGERATWSENESRARCILSLPLSLPRPLAVASVNFFPFSPAAGRARYGSPRWRQRRRGPFRTGRRRGVSAPRGSRSRASRCRRGPYFQDLRRRAIPPCARAGTWIRSSKASIYAQHRHQKPGDQSDGCREGGRIPVLVFYLIRACWTYQCRSLFSGGGGIG